MLLPNKLANGYVAGRSFQTSGYRYQKAGFGLREDAYPIDNLCSLLESQLWLCCKIPNSVIKHFFLVYDYCLYDHIIYAFVSQTSGMRTSGFSSQFERKSKPELLFAFDENLVSTFKEYLIRCKTAIQDRNISTDISLFASPEIDLLT